MPSAPPTFRPPWAPIYKRDARRQYDERRGSARERGYDTRWEKARHAYLAAHPLCCCCLANGVAHPAKVVDHVEPHKGDKSKFWNSTMWQPLCEWCHNAVKQPLEDAWSKGKVEASALFLSRQIAGWMHPAAR